jgi:hypothetical protein
MLLEEIVLWLLRRSGYRAVDVAGSDATLLDGKSGLEVRGRGEDHQIDAIADQAILLPFANPARMLVEAKCVAKNVGLPVVRNALGVLHDVSQYWIPASRIGLVGAPHPLITPVKVPLRRYHYQFAIVSATGFSKEAQNFAYAHDIKLLPLGGSAFLSAVVAQVAELSDAEFTQIQRAIPLQHLRQRIRSSLRGGALLPDGLEPLPILEEILEATRTVNSAILARTSSGIDLFLVPAQGLQLRELLARPNVVRLSREGDSWFIYQAGAGNQERRLFSFDLPDTTFRLAAEEGRSERERLANLKRHQLGQIHAIVDDEQEGPQLLQLDLDPGWIDDVLRRIREDQH